MKYSPAFFKKGLPEWKRKKDPLLLRLFYRPVSFVLSSLFCHIHWSANMVSYFSALVAIAACTCFVLGCPFVGAILINVWLLLDCADGNIARCVHKERFGDFADSMSSYICVGFMFVCMGYFICVSGGVLFHAGDYIIIFIGALAGSSDSLMRLLHQKYKNSAYAQGLDASSSEDPEQESGINRLRMKVDQWASLGGGLLPALVLVGVVLGFLDVVVCAWAVYYVATFVASSLYFVAQTFAQNKETDSNGGQGVE